MGSGLCSVRCRRCPCTLAAPRIVSQSVRMVRRVADAVLPLAWPRRGRTDGVEVLAHRGGSGPWHENSLEAFTSALRFGADGVELDVRLSADGELVVHHDAEVAGVGLIHELRFDALPQWVPTLGQALATCAGAVVNVEIKNMPTDVGYDPSNRVSEVVASVLAEGVGAGGPGPAHVIVSSFWPDALVAVGRVNSSEALGLLVHPALDVFDALDTAGTIRCAALHPHHSQVTTELVARAHARGLAVVTWTVNSPAEIDAAVAAGVDALITDSVAATLDHLGRP
jgi:glycerophosphoryl diester phosphodiesterase